MTAASCNCCGAGWRKKSEDVRQCRDAGGRLKNWWTEEDFAHFKASSEKLIAQYDAYRPFPVATASASGSRPS
jgi:hypothetical protein